MNIFCKRHKPSKLTQEEIEGEVMRWRSRGYPKLALSLKHNWINIKLFWTPKKLIWGLRGQTAKLEIKKKNHILEAVNYRELIWGSKVLPVLWWGGSPNHRGRRGREGEKGGKEIGRERTEKWAGGRRRKTLLQNHWLGKGEGLTTSSFYKQWSAKSEVVEVHAIASVVRSRFTNAPVQKEDRDQRVWGPPGSHG